HDFGGGNDRSHLHVRDAARRLDRAGHQRGAARARDRGLPARAGALEREARVRTFELVRVRRHQRVARSRAVTIWTAEKKLEAAIHGPMSGAGGLLRGDTQVIERPGWYELVTPGGGEHGNEVVFSRVEDDVE